MTKENRITIFTKNSSSRYGGRALVLDLTRKLNHLYNSVVAKHPIEGVGYSVADHAYPENIVIGISGHVSNAVAPPPQRLNLESYDPFGQYRNQDAYKNSLVSALEESTIDKNIIEDRDPEDPLTESELEIVDKYTISTGLSVGDLLPDEIVSAMISTMGSTIDQIKNRINTVEENSKVKSEIDNNKNLRPLYQTDQASKQLDAFEFLEAIRSERLLCDVLTTTKLYQNMFMSSLALPRDIGQGCSLEVRMVFEQQRFTTINESIFSFNPGEVSGTEEKGKDQGNKVQEGQEEKTLGRFKDAILRLSGSILKD
jgi:hypothetical protein